MAFHLFFESLHVPAGWARVVLNRQRYTVAINLHGRRVLPGDEVATCGVVACLCSADDGVSSPSTWPFRFRPRVLIGIMFESCVILVVHLSRCSFRLLVRDWVED